MDTPAPAEKQSSLAELTLRIAERAHRLAQEHGMEPGGELALWLQAETQVKREARSFR